MFYTAGMLSKAKGQILRTAATLHALFEDSVDPESGELTISTVISDEALLASINFVDTCCQHAAFIAGRGIIEDEIKQLLIGKSVVC